MLTKYHWKFSQSVGKNFTVILTQVLSKISLYVFTRCWQNLTRYLHQLLTKFSVSLQQVLANVFTGHWQNFTRSLLQVLANFYWKASPCVDKIHCKSKFTCCQNFPGKLRQLFVKFHYKSPLRVDKMSLEVFTRCWQNLTVILQQVLKNLTGRLHQV